MGHYIEIEGANCGDFCDPYDEMPDGRLNYNPAKKREACRQCRFAFNTQYKNQDGSMDWDCGTKLIAPGTYLAPCKLRTIYYLASEILNYPFLYRPRKTSFITIHDDGTETQDIAPAYSWWRRVRNCWHLWRVIRRVRKDDLPVQVQLWQRNGAVSAGIFIDLERWTEFWTVLRDARPHIRVSANESSFIKQNASRWEVSNIKRLRAAMLVALANDAEVRL